MSIASQTWPKVLQARKHQEEASSKTNAQDLLAALKACSKARNLEKGKHLHIESEKCGHLGNVYVANAIINMYAKCGSMINSRAVFDNMKHVTVVSWTALILGYAENDQGLTALHIFTRMRSEGPDPNSVTFVAALKAWISLRWEKRTTDCGIVLHNIAVEHGYNSDVFVQSTLIDMYTKYGIMTNAHTVFDSMKHPDVVSWTALILGYADNGQGSIGLELFSMMRIQGVVPDSVTLVAALKACTSLAINEGSNQWAQCRERGKEIHDFSLENGCSSDVYLQNTLIDMYAKFRSMMNAQEVFDGIRDPNVVSWNVLILGYADNNEAYIALDMFSRMKDEGLEPDSVTMVAVLKACTFLVVKEEATGWAVCRDKCKEIHNITVEIGCSADDYVRNSLADMYGKCGSMEDARAVFVGIKYLDAVSWNVLILGYAENGQGHTGLELFSRMRTEGPPPNSVTLVSALKACGSLAMNEGANRLLECRDRARQLHNFVVENGCISEFSVQSTLIEMYAKCGNMSDASEVFDDVKLSDIVSWNVMILGYTDNGQGHTALELFTRLRAEGTTPDSVTFVAALKACGLVEALEFGRRIHSEIDCGGADLDAILVNRLVDFYVKCGSLVEAQSVFYLHAERRNVITWNSLLSGFSSCGDNEAVFELFQEMQDAGFQPNSVTLVCILTCCSHAGLVEKGKECFDALSKKYGISPTLEHYNCMFDIFGRANKLDDAMALLKHMPCSPDEVTWRTILSACGKWKNVETGKLAFQSLIDLNDRDAAAYVLMGQIYGSRGMLQEEEMIMGLRKMSGAYKKPEETCWTAGDAHTFLVEDQPAPTNSPNPRQIGSYACTDETAWLHAKK